MRRHSVLSTLSDTPGVTHSCFLVGLFLLFKFLPKDLVNTILSAYFVFLVRCTELRSGCAAPDTSSHPALSCAQGVLAIAACMAPFAAALMPRRLARRTVRGAMHCLRDGRLLSCL